MLRFTLALVPVLALALAACGSVTSGNSNTAASVNGHDIAMSAYTTQLNYNLVNSKSATGYDVCSVKAFVALCRQVKQQTMTTLIDDELVREYAARHHIVVSNADFNRNWAIIYRDDFHNQPRVLQAHAQSLGLTVAQFKAMQRRNLLQQTVLYDVTKSLPARVPAVRLSRIDVATKAQLHHVQALLKSGRSFDSVAISLIKDPKSFCARMLRKQCGDVGWLPNALVSADERRVITAPTGTIVGPVFGQIAYELLQVKGHNAHYLLTTSQSLAVRKQLFSAWLLRQQQQASIKRYVAA